MTKIVWLSDLHFRADGPVQGYDTSARLSAAIAFLNAHQADAACCVISGDLVDHGQAADYATLAERLSEVAVPVYPLVGNHDDRALMRAHFPIPQAALPDFVQYAVDLGSVLLLCLDTQEAGSDAGAFCAARADWLAQALSMAGDRQVLIFLHHPPFDLDLPMQDRDRMRNGDAFLDLVTRFDCRIHLCIGHVHRPISGAVRGIPFTTMRSVLYQAPAPRPAWDWDTFSPAREAPDLGVITVREEAVVIQFQSFCDAAFGHLPSWPGRGVPDG